MTVLSQFISNLYNNILRCFTLLHNHTRRLKVDNFLLSNIMQQDLLLIHVQKIVNIFGEEWTI